MDRLLLHHLKYGQTDIIKILIMISW